MHVIATAGHVDHGKSTLIRALTGMEPDRWAEERRRGMTIDLGFAWTTLSDGTQIAFVDVPGHQRFISNMLAGIGPVPAVLLVVAADEGWARQTSEHVAALEALGVTHGVLAITRSDLGDADLALEEARLYLTGTGLESIEAVTVSPVADTGMNALRAALIRMAAQLHQPVSVATRLWIDRVFTITGAGTVVTGTLGTGTIRVGDHLTVSGTGETVHVRGLQTLKTVVNSASAVARVAVNLRGVKTTQLHRGDALIRRELWTRTRALDVRVVHAATTLPAEPILHLGSAAVPVRLRPLGADTARLVLRSALPLHVGERGLLRDPGPERVVAGIVVLDTDPPALRRRGAATRRAGELVAVTGLSDPGGEIHRRHAVHREQLIAAGHLQPDDAPPSGAVVADGWLVDGEYWALWQRQLREATTNWAKRHPRAPGIPSAAAVRQLALPDPNILGQLIRQMPELTHDANGIHHRGTAAKLPQAADAAVDRLVAQLTAQPFAAADAAELDAAGLTQDNLAIATKIGRLLCIAPSVYLLPDAPQQAARALAALSQPFTTSQARQALNTTRRVAVPLLEYLDRRRITRRIDTDHRALRT